MMTGDDAWIAAERKHEREMAGLKADADWQRQKHRHESVGWAICGAVLVAVVGILALLIWWMVGNSTRANTQRDVACNESGGTRLPIQNGPVLCIHITGAMDVTAAED